MDNEKKRNEELIFKVNYLLFLNLNIFILNFIIEHQLNLILIALPNILFCYLLLLEEILRNY